MNRLLRRLSLTLVVGLALAAALLLFTTPREPRGLVHLTEMAFLKTVLGSAYPGLDEEGWRILTRNWAWFFAFMALLNEAVWRSTTTDFWIGFKLWGAIPLTFLFGAANVPMLIRHGLTKEEAAEVNEPGPVE